MATTVEEQINGSMRLLNLFDETESANATQLANGLSAFNQMIDSWSIERLSVYSTQDQSFTWPANTRTVTLGPSTATATQILGVRPIQVDDSSYFVQPGTGVSYNFSIVNEEQYNGIALKGSTSTFPIVMCVNYDVPDITMKVYPVPTIALTFHIVSVQELLQTDDITDDLIIPPGYLRAFRFNLACEIASEFGISAPRKVERIADVSKRAIKRINNPGDLLAMPSSLVSRRGSQFNIFSGDQ